MYKQTTNFDGRFLVHGDLQEELALISLLDAEAAYQAIVLCKDVVQVCAVAAVAGNRKAIASTALVLVDGSATTAGEGG